MFGQLAKSESLRDLIVALEAHWRKLYHLGMGKSVTRSNHAKANEQRNFSMVKFRKHEDGIKVHMLYDIEAQVPVFFHITPASTNDMKVSGYNDFSNLFKIEQIEVTFIIRASKNLKFKQTSWKRNLPKNVLSDSTIKSSKDYPVPLRGVVYITEEQGKEFVFLTNNVELPALVIVELYQQSLEY